MGHEFSRHECMACVGVGVVLLVLHIGMWGVSAA